MGNAQFDQYGRLRLKDNGNQNSAVNPSNFPQTTVPVPYQVTPNPQPTYTPPSQSTSPWDDQIGTIVAWGVGIVVGLILLCCFWYIILPIAAAVGIIAGLANDTARPVILWLLGAAAVIAVVCFCIALIVELWPILLVILIICAIFGGA